MAFNNPHASVVFERYKTKILMSSLTTLNSSPSPMDSYETVISLLAIECALIHARTLEIEFESMYLSTMTHPSMSNQLEANYKHWKSLIEDLEKAKCIFEYVPKVKCMPSHWPVTREEFDE